MNTLIDPEQFRLSPERLQSIATQVLQTYRDHLVDVKHQLPRYEHLYVSLEPLEHVSLVLQGIHEPLHDYCRQRAEAEHQQLHGAFSPVPNPWEVRRSVKASQPTCGAVIKSGKRKGQLCGKAGCRVHKDAPQIPPAEPDPEPEAEQSEPRDSSPLEFEACP